MNYHPSDSAIDALVAKTGLGRIQARNQLIAQWLLSRVGAVPKYS